MIYLLQVELSGDRFIGVGKVLLQADTGEQVHICRAINIYKWTGKTMQ